MQAIEYKIFNLILSKNVYFFFIAKLKNNTQQMWINRLLIINKKIIFITVFVINIYLISNKQRNLKWFKKKTSLKLKYSQTFENHHSYTHAKSAKVKTSHNIKSALKHVVTSFAHDVKICLFCLVRTGLFIYQYN